ncbi:MAG: hypothetical protein HY332_00655 [Chloroflexi bacterium]|nr:hypothetical protein [Chloroflexota bacterium]
MAPTTPAVERARRPTFPSPLVGEGLGVRGNHAAAGARVVARRLTLTAVTRSPPCCRPRRRTATP